MKKIWHFQLPILGQFFNQTLKNAFLRGDLKETIYMTPLLGYVVPNTKYVCRL